MAQARLAVVAVRPFAYRGDEVVPGEVCLVRPVEAAALLYRAQARWPTSGETLEVYQRRDLVATAPPVVRRRRKAARP